MEMNFFRSAIDDLKHAERPQITFEVVNGKHKLLKSPSKVFNMRERGNIDHGVVKLNKKMYYFVGLHEKEEYERNTGKMATSAIIGGVLLGGIGAVAGGLLGSEKSSVPFYTLELADYETKEIIVINVKLKSNSFRKFKKFHIVDFDSLQTN